MKLSLVLGTALYALQGLAFPSMLTRGTSELPDLSTEQMQQLKELLERLNVDVDNDVDVLDKRGLGQLIDVHGDHEWVRQYYPPPKSLVM
jgi:hypothetical protein